MKSNYLTYQYKVAIMKYDSVLKSGYTYPKKLWEKIIDNGLYKVPIFGEKEDPTTEFGRVSDISLENGNVVITIDINRNCTWGSYIFDNYVDRNKKLNAKPFLLCHLNGRVIDPDDFILNYFYLVDYSEDTNPINDPKASSTFDIGGSNSTKDNSKQDTSSEETFAKDNVSFNDIISTANDKLSIASDEEMLKKFLSVSSDTEKLFKT